MFILSVRASTLKFAGLILLTLAILVSAITLSGTDTVYASANGKEINYGGMKSNEDRVNFIKGFGIEVKEEPEKTESFAMPGDFDRIISGYNELQKAQGLDLAKYKNKRVTHYSYEVTNYKSEAKVTVNLLVYKNRIIGCDISSAEENGFVLPLTEINPENLN